MSTRFATMPAHAHAHVARPMPALKTENFDMDSFIDFNQAGPSPTSGPGARPDATPRQDWSALSPFDQPEEHSQQFSGPSHDYGQFKQQVGLPAGSMINMPPNGMFDGYASGIGEVGFDAGFAGYGTGIDMDSEMTMDFSQPTQGTAAPAMFFPPPQQQGQGDAFVNPSTIAGQEEAASNVGRLWPGMHSQQAQQAAMHKQAQQQMIQQRQMKMQAYQQQHRQSTAGPSQVPAQQRGNAKRHSNAAEPHVEESISRLLQQMRQNSAASASDDADSEGGLLPHIARMRKDEEEMDEDERLLASDEGKKLSSKERRQLRNKVSARAFRSRRKEYIGQLEGDLAVKAQEAQTLRSENTALASENERYRGLIETLLRHPAFHPFIDDISKNPAALGAIVPAANGMQMQQTVQPTPNQHPSMPHQQSQSEEIKSEHPTNFDMQAPTPQPQQQQQQPQQQQHRQQIHHVGMTMIPEENFSKLNIKGFGQAMDFNQFSSVDAFPITSLPESPNHVELLSELPASYLATSDFSTNYDSSSNLDALLSKLDRSATRISREG